MIHFLANLIRLASIRIIDSDVKSDCSKCVSGFPDMPVAEVGGRTDSDNVITILIPGMNFTHNATIAGYIVARNSQMLVNSKIQI